MAKAAVIFAKGFEEIEALAVVDVLRRCNVETHLAGLSSGIIESTRNIGVVMEKTIDDVNASDYDAIVIPGGNPGYANLRKDARAVRLVKEFFAAGKLVCAICAGPTVIGDAGILKGKRCTSYPGAESEVSAFGAKWENRAVVEDGNIITSQGPATTIEFGLKIAARFTDAQTVETVAKKMLFYGKF